MAGPSPRYVTMSRKEFLTSLNLLGGLPYPIDKLPSTIFLLVYIGLLVATIYRLTRRQSPASIHVRVLLAIVCRAVALGCRIAIAGGHRGADVWSAQEMMWIWSPLLLFSALASLTERAFRPYRSVSPFLFKHFATVIHLLVAAIGVWSVLGVTSLRKAINGNISSYDRLLTMKKIGAWTLFGAVCLNGVVILTAFVCFQRRKYNLSVVKSRKTERCKMAGVACITVLLFIKFMFKGVRRSGVQVSRAGFYAGWLLPDIIAVATFALLPWHRLLAEPTYEEQQANGAPIDPQCPPCLRLVV
ncbi:hypothetical protein CBOM_02163 [Ceraceosorus bombacis]|uniref:Uncharacterized protein n=1 Tax=Ceraceosorus bombacis TaxID=401625 RepID=A0A0P1BEM9_9BASI|nr:hypothetical protein CBOM_02163 [Ceraceosorus bombacis]